MLLKLRLLLTNACSARCAYCHNEGQQKASDRLDLAAIEHLLDTLAGGGVDVSEIVLSGGEPTLHPQLPEIARRCKASGAMVSINTHAGHPTKLMPALPWLDELKIHVDSFDPQRQRASMGIGVAKVRQSITAAKDHGDLQLFINHPLQSIHEASAVIDAARALDVDVKLIELLDTSCGQGLPRQPIHFPADWRLNKERTMFAFANFTNSSQENTMNETPLDLIDNPTPRCPVALVLDSARLPRAGNVGAHQSGRPVGAVRGKTGEA